MVREKPLPYGILNKIPGLLKELGKYDELAAVYFFGSGSYGKLNPLSDLDFGILIHRNVDSELLFKMELKFRGILSNILETDEFDLVLLNTAPARFAYNIIAKGNLILCKNDIQVIDFIELTNKTFLDFKYFKDEFNIEFQRRIGLTV